MLNVMKVFVVALTFDVVNDVVTFSYIYCNPRCDVMLHYSASLLGH